MRYVNRKPNVLLTYDADSIIYKIIYQLTSSSSWGWKRLMSGNGLILEGQIKREVDSDVSDCSWA